MPDPLADLNPRQREAVEHCEGPLLILAGAGSGKTRVITRRIAHLMAVRRVPARAILAVTFTNKAAAEMRERVLAQARGGEPPLISTFHSFCVRLLRGEYAAIGGRNDFLIYADDEQMALLKAIAKRLGVDDKQLPPRGVLARISHAKNRGEDPRALLARAGDPRAEQTAVMYDYYQRGLRQANALDFDDLLLEAERLLRESEATAARWNDRLQYVHVDEYQDTNRPQYQLLRLLTRRRGNACVVGDEDQSIYSWRGADLRNILDFERDFPGAAVIRLEQNYRSTRNILDAASAVVANNIERKGKTLWTEAGGGAAIGLYIAPDGENEALWTAEETRRQLGRGGDRRVAILYRTNAQSRPFEEALRRYDVRYKIVGGFSFYERAEVKDLLAYLKIAVHPEDSISLLRVINTPPRGIGRGTLDALERVALERNLPLAAALDAVLDSPPAAAAAAGPLIAPLAEDAPAASPAGTAPPAFSPRALASLAGFRDLLRALRALAAGGAGARELLRAVLEKTEYARLLEREDSPDARGRLENIEELLNAAADAAEREESIAEFLDHAALVNDQDEFDAAAPVTLMTLHAAKGLEFHLVFLVGMEDGLFPHGRAIGAPRELEEERRLCYVGMTRAREQLILTRACYRRRFGAGSLEPTLASRFLGEVPEALVQDLSPRSLAQPADPRGNARLDADVSPPSHATPRSDHSVGPVYVREGFSQERWVGRSQERSSPRPAPVAPWRPASTAREGAGGLRLGARVKHARFGTGTVLRIEGEADDRKVTVSFPGFGLKKMVEKFADLRPLK